MIDEIGRQLAAKPESERPNKVVVIIVTAGQDSASDSVFSNSRLCEKIEHQQNFYSWKFVFPFADLQRFHPTVVRIREPVKKTTFQFAADIVIANESVDSVYEQAIDLIYDWLTLGISVRISTAKYFNICACCNNAHEVVPQPAVQEKEDYW